METLFISVQKRIADGMTDLLIIDEDTGQLEFPDNEGYPVMFPCALINIQQTPWTNAGKGMQMGTATIVVKLAIDCYDDTHYKSGTERKAYYRMLKAKELHKLLHGFAGRIIKDDDETLLDTNFSPLSRTLSRDYSRPGGIKVYERTYTTEITDRSAVPVLNTVARPSIKINTEA